MTSDLAVFQKIIAQNKRKGKANQRPTKS